MLTASSSAIVIPFQPSTPPLQNGEKTPTFVQVAKAWLERWQADERLTLADRALATQIFLKFNQERYQRTGELLAWPSWEYLIAKTTTHKATIARGFRNLERVGALEIIHGGRDPQTGWKLSNQYRAIHQVSPCDLARSQMVSNPGRTSSPITSEVRTGEKERTKFWNSNSGVHLSSLSLNGCSDVPRAAPNGGGFSEQQLRWIAEDKSPFTGIPKKRLISPR
jgi:hypothetical protein